jgi:multisubunit Na+/H+ antiporter MnhE subunit
MRQASLRREVSLSLVEFVWLLLLWMMFVSKANLHELWVGIGAAALGSVADAVVKAKNFAPFRPRARWVVLGLHTGSQIVIGTYQVAVAFVRSVAGRKPRASFRALSYEYGGNDEVSAAKRALFTAYVTLSPDSIVVGIDREQQIALIHYITREKPSTVARRLGAQE